MKTRLIFICLICLSAIGFAQKSSSIGFVIKNLGINVDGYFNTFSVITDFDTDGTLTNISGRITVSSINTGIDSRDEHLLKEDYFGVENHKYITLKSTDVTKKSDKSYTVKADLSIKGITKKISINVDVSKTSEGYKASSSFEIDRKDFKVGGSSFVMSKTVKVYVIHYQKL